MIKWALLKRCDFARLILLYRTGQGTLSVTLPRGEFLTNQTVGKMIHLFSKYRLSQLKRDSGPLGTSIHHS